MELVPATHEHLAALRSWFPDRASAEEWGGPRIRYPFDRESFLRDIHWGELPSWACLGDRGELAGFGQYYEDHGMCRLARLAVAPGRRGHGVGRRMIAELIRIGLEDLDATECCLVVLEGNRAAIRCYESLGFVDAEVPDGESMYPGTRFMRRPAD